MLLCGQMEPLELVPGRYIGEGQPCFVIAEIGQNHQGDIQLAKTLIRRAKVSQKELAYSK